MDHKFYFTVLVVSIFASSGFCDRFKGIPVMFPTDVVESLNVINSKEQKPFSQYVSTSKSDSTDSSSSHLKPEITNENPSPTQSKPYNTKYPYPYSYLSYSNSRSLYPSELNYDHGYPTTNTINSAPKTFAQMEAPPCVTTSELDGLCEEDSDYNWEIEERFSKALEKINVSEGFYESILSKMMVETSVSFTSRIGNDRILEDPVCPASEKFIFPKRGMTRSNEWVFLLNQGNVKQAIKVEECLNTTRLSRLRVNGDLTCGITTDTGVESVCRQKFIFKNMIAMDRSGSNVVTEAILIPSCCVCLRKNSANRFGMDDNGLEFDEFGNLITELPPKAQNNKFESRSQKIPEFQNDDEDFSFSLPKL